MPKLSLSGTTLILSATVALSACNWVDSTGNQDMETQSIDEITVAETIFESSVRTLQPSEAIGLLENTVNRIQLADVDTTLQQWTWELQDESDANLCTSIDGFDQQFTENSLLQACTDQTQCDISIEENIDDLANEFVIDIPQLKAPVALTYLLSAQSNEGDIVKRQQTVCAVSVNEAPLANDDMYKVVAGSRLDVRGIDSDSLIGNDSDDIDVRNQPLVVDTQVVIAPRYADIFTLQSDGGFIYQPASDIPANEQGTLLDSFVYRVGDGLHQVEATATISIVVENTAPMLIQPLPPVEIVVGDERGEVFTYTTDISVFFNDVDNDALIYTLTDDELPDALITNISEQGLLSISIEPEASVSLAAEWPIGITASDGVESITTELLLIVVDLYRPSTS